MLANLTTENTTGNLINTIKMYKLIGTFHTTESDSSLCEGMLLTLTSSMLLFISYDNLLLSNPIWTRRFSLLRCNCSHAYCCCLLGVWGTSAISSQITIPSGVWKLHPSSSIYLLIHLCCAHPQQLMLVHYIVEVAVWSCGSVSWMAQLHHSAEELASVGASSCYATQCLSQLC